MKMPQRIVLTFLVCVLALGVIASPNATCSQQDPAADYLTDAVPEQFNLVGLDPRTDRNKFSQVRSARSDFESKVSTALSSPNALSGADQSAVLNWVGQVLMAEMTTLNPDAQAKLGDLRQEFFRKIVRATSDNNRAYLLNVILPKAVDIASKNYHPAARVNAVIIMGLLDSQEGISGQRPPKPHLAALGELLKIVDDPQSPDYLVAASLSGLQRHAEIDGQLPARDRMQPAVRTMMVDSMLRLIAKYDANQTEDQPGYLLSRRAVQTLDGLSLPAADPKTAEVKAALTKVATKMEAGKWLRLDAFLALSRLPIDDPKVYLENLGQLVVYVTKDSRARVLLAQKMVKIDQLIKEKTGFAQAKKKTTSQRQRTGPMIGSGGGESMRVGDGDGMPGAGGGMGGGMGGMDGMGDFSEDGLFPFHLHYARTDVKIVVAGTRSILGTADKTPTGLKAAFADKPETVKLIDQLEKELKALLAVTDIGFVEEKPLSESQKRTMNPNELFLREQSNSVRVLAGMGQSAESLEKIVGIVELPKTETVDPPLATTPVGVASSTNPPPAGDSAATTAENNDTGSTEGTQESTSGEAGATTGGEAGATTGGEGSGGR